MSKEKIEDLEFLIKGQEGLINRARHVSTDDQYYQANKDRLSKHIATLQAQLDDLEYQRNEADEIIATAEKRIKALKAALHNETHRSEIAKLIKLQKQIHKLEDHS